MSRNSMFFKLFLAFSLIGTVLFVGLLTNDISESQRALYTQKSEDMRLHIDRTGQFLDLYLQNITNVLFSIAKTNELSNMNNTKIEKLLKQYKDNNSTTIGNIFIIRNDRQIISSEQLLYDIIGNPQLMKLYQIAYENYGIVNWSDPYYSPMQVGQTVAFSLPMSDNNGLIGGVIVLEIDLDELNRKLSGFLYNTGQSFVILNDSGKVVSFDRSGSLDIYPNRDNPIAIKSSFIQRLKILPDGLQKIKVNHSNLMVIKSKQNRLGWYVVSLTDEKVFRKPMTRLFMHSLQIGMFWLTVLLLLTFVFSRYFTRPLKRLALQMDRIKEGRISIKVAAVHRKDEIGVLSRSFQEMMDRIQQLMEEQKMAEVLKKRIELKMLLSQIRPHFLYNTLVCIGSLAQQNRGGEVEETIRSLIKLLTFSIDKKEEIISLSEELDCLNAFVQIQKVRYGDSFRFILDVPPALYALKIPKLLLQPLVENAIFHGIAERENGEIVVHASVEENCLYLSVKDNGIGIAPERLHSLNKTRSNEGVLHSNGMNSIGIQNIRERIQLLYGEPYGLSIHTVPQVMTEICLHLPFSTQ